MAMVEERLTNKDNNADEDLVSPPTVVPPEEAFLNVHECATPTRKAWARLETTWKRTK